MNKVESEPTSIKMNWTRSLIISIFSSIIFQLLIFLTNTNNYSNISFNPYTFYWVWILSAIMGVFYIIFKINVRLINFILISFFYGPILIILFSFIIPDNLRIEGNYYGIQSRYNLDMHEEGYYDEIASYDNPIEVGYLYKKDDPELLKEYGSKTELNESVSFRGFIFWQSGMANGFDPIFIKEYNVGNTLLDKIELYFTIGPISLLECILQGSMNYFPFFFAVTVIWYLFTKRHIWWDNRTKLFPPD